LAYGVFNHRQMLAGVDILRLGYAGSRVDYIGTPESL
jgi:hypothetical protein